MSTKTHNATSDDDYQKIEWTTDAQGTHQTRIGTHRLSVRPSGDGSSVVQIDGRDLPLHYKSVSSAQNEAIEILFIDCKRAMKVIEESWLSIPRQHYAPKWLGGECTCYGSWMSDPRAHYEECPYPKSLSARETIVATDIHIATEQIV